MATKQVIEIDVTWTGWSRLKLNSLISFLASADTSNLQIKRISVREKK